MKHNYYERASKFIDVMLPYLAECEKVSDFQLAVKKFCYFHPRRKVLCDNGSGRIAIITSDYVIKMDRFDGSADWGNCRSEFNLYQKVKDSDFDYLFAETKPVERGQFTFYVMPRIKGVDSRQYWADAYMTDDEYKFVRSLGVRDMHPGNFGIRHGKVCLIDYAAY